MLRDKLNIRKNDKVKVLSGKDRGKIGKVLAVDAQKNRVLVENINMMKHHKRPNVQFREGGIVEKEAPIHSSNAMVICGKCNSKTRVGKKVLSDKKIARVCKKCGEMIGSSS